LYSGLSLLARNPCAQELHWGPSIFWRATNVRISLPITVLALAASLTASTALFAQSEEAERVAEAAKVFDEIMGMPDKAIPEAILEKAEAIAVFPSTLKGGFGIGVHRGKGILSARNRATGGWSRPAFLTLTGGSFGAQIGAQAIDLVLVVMNQRGLENLLKNEFKIGADASVAAGPVGRGAEASTDIQLRAEILSYSRTRGLFAGVSLNGSALNEDEEANQRFYGRAVRNAELVEAPPQPVGTSGAKQAGEVAAWHAALKKYAR
jgi:lipid-binding SYLF domain-containing protein